MVPPTAHRIFTTPWLHELQVRYPWAGGYAAAPIAFNAAARFNLQLLSGVAGPLFAGVKSTAALQAHVTAAAAAFTIHFLRRLLEGLFINDYTGTFVRDSRLELLYYTAWGLLAGAAVSPASLARWGVPARPLRYLGLTLFAIGQVGNAWCHYELRRLRSAANQLGASHYTIPSRGPFGLISCPHYSFELLTWVGYVLHSGVDAPSMMLLAMSTIAMAPFARDRHMKYVKLFKEGQRANGDPSLRWKMVPFVW